MKGELRQNITNNCPEEFLEELNDYITIIEQNVLEVVNLLNIEDIGALSNIEDAFMKADKLADSLY